MVDHASSMHKFVVVPLRGHDDRVRMFLWLSVERSLGANVDDMQGLVPPTELSSLSISGQETDPELFHKLVAVLDGSVRW